MIVKMKKITVLTLGSEEEATLKDLRKLGIVHLIPGGERVFNHSELTAKIDETNKLINIIETRDQPELKDVSGINPDTLAANLKKLLDRLEETEKKKAAVAADLAMLDVWGDFDRRLFEKIWSSGLHVYLCAGRPKSIDKVREVHPDAAVELLRTSGGTHFFAVISREKIDHKLLPLAKLPDEKMTDNRQLREQYALLESEIKKINSEIDRLAQCRAILGVRMKKLNQELAFEEAQSSLRSHGQIVTLQGFIPEYSEENIVKEARKKGWGVLVREPDADDLVPTLVKLPKWARIVQPLFQFLGISPGYDEIDVSGAVLIFFGIFTSMIIGDAGYGFIFLVVSILGWFYTKRNFASRRMVKFLMFLSVATIFWGLLTANIFGKSSIFGQEIPGLAWFTDPNFGSKNTQLFCFFIAAAHLSLGHVWQAIVNGRIRSILGNLGWILVLWGNFFLSQKMIVYPGDFPQHMYYLYGAGFILVVFAGVNWLDISEVFNFPFNIINSFVDMLSYIRLYAVGMAGYYIAVSFNGMAASLAEVSEFAMIGAIIVVILGHLLNIGLAAMGVLVHGVRLNTLEFSNHAGLTWSGYKFNPFKKTSEGDNQ